MPIDTWIRLGGSSTWGEFICWVTGGHDWRYHLEKPRRMCIKCRIKEVKRPAREADDA